MGFGGKNFMLSKSFDKFYFKNDLNLMLELGKAFIIAGGWLRDNWEWTHTPGSSFAQDRVLEGEAYRQLRPGQPL